MQDGKPVDALFPGFHVVIDEFQSVTSLAIVEALAGIRKSRISMTLCHQHTDQIAPEVLAAIKGNIGTKIIFRVGGDDSKRLHETVELPNPKELSNQSDYNFILQYKTGSSVATKRACSVMADYPRQGQAKRIIGYSQGNYARPVSEVEAQYERWLSSRHYGGVPKLISKPTVKKKQASAMRSVGAIMLDRGYLPTCKDKKKTGA